MTFPALAAGIMAGARILVLVIASAAGVVALTHWAVRQRHLSAFGPLPRAVRRLSDPVLRPLEVRMVRWGRNPQDATLWLVGLAVVGGILLLSLLGWILNWVGQILALSGAGATSWLRLVIDTTTQVLVLAILVRVIGSWVGASDYTRWMRPFVWLTEWVVAPIRRRLPTFGPLDFSPIVAYFAILLGRAVLYLFLL